MSLEHQRVLVVGGSAGMGLATANALARARAEVIIAGRTRQRLEAARSQLPEGVKAITIDIHNPERLSDLIPPRAGPSPLDHLVLTASGSVAWGPFSEVSGEALLAALEHKLVGYWRTIQAALPILRKDGSVTVLTGAASRKALPGTAALAAVNGGLTQMAMTLAKELAPLRVNVLSPGLIDTPAYDGMPEQAKKAMFEGAAQTLPIGRVGTVEEVAEAVLLLVSNAYITGAVFDVDGGTRI